TRYLKGTGVREIIMRQSRFAEYISLLVTKRTPFCDADIFWAR
ncbi:11860_t:CDS:2, partial [Acaulospora morrowiae]